MKFLFSISVIFLTASTFAATSPIPRDGISIKTKFNYLTKANKRISTSKEFILANEKNQIWVTLTELIDNVVLLGRIKELTDQTIHMEYLVVDGNQKPNGVVSMPSIVGMFDIPSEISTGEPGEKPTLFISMTAKKTEYTPENK